MPASTQRLGHQLYVDRVSGVTACTVVRLFLPIAGVRGGANVAELTGIPDLTGWPTDMRVIVRRERPHPGAQLRFDDVDGYRLTAYATNTRTEGIVEVPDARRFLERLTDLGVPWAVVTSASREVASVRLKAAGIAVPPIMVSADECSDGKPASTPYLMGLPCLASRPPTVSRLRTPRRGLSLR